MEEAEPSTASSAISEELTVYDGRIVKLDKSHVSASGNYAVWHTRRIDTEEQEIHILGVGGQKAWTDDVVETLRTITTSSTAPVDEMEFFNRSDSHIILRGTNCPVDSECGEVQGYVAEEIASLLREQI